ncbi:MAG: CmcI family methyltransferase [Dehalococcoidia bacterium]
MIERQPTELLDDFHQFYYDSQTWQNTYWLGVPTLKCPLDMWVYQEVIFETKPDIIVECGTYMGGSALYMASLFDLIGEGKIVTVDIESRLEHPKHRRIEYITGSSIDDAVVEEVRRRIGEHDRVMVILDSDHSEGHVAKELRAYAPMVSLDGYLIVEDTNINGNPVYENFGPGPKEALDAFLRDVNDFEVDRSREKFFVSFNPGGWLRRVSRSDLG